jgi:hypothetical protein
VIPYEQIAEALARFKAERHAAEAGGAGTQPPDRQSGGPNGSEGGEVEADEVLEPEPE